MSSAKRRKVDGDVPSGLKDKKKEAPVANPAPSSPPREPEEPEQQKEEAAPKSFKDLVRIIYSRLTNII
jgi:ATP-dependent RNA helicase DDX47/RRP3